MKDLAYYLNLNYKMEVQKDESEGGYIFSFPDLKGCMTCADELQAGVLLAEDAKKEWLATALEDGYSIPEPTGVQDFSGQFKLRIPKTLHKELAERSKNEGISMNQYCLYLLSKSSQQPPHVQ